MPVDDRSTQQVENGQDYPGWLDLSIWIGAKRSRRAVAQRNPAYTMRVLRQTTRRSDLGCPRGSLHAGLDLVSSRADTARFDQQARHAPSKAGEDVWRAWIGLAPAPAAQ